jgi:hypothetical protein
LLPRCGGFGGTSAGCGGGWSRSRSCDIDARYLLDAPLVLLPALLPVDEEEEPAPVSVDVVLGGVDAVVDDVLSLVVDELVGAVVLGVELGVELVPELLYEVLVPGLLLQPARAPVARAMAAM